MVPLIITLLRWEFVVTTMVIFFSAVIQLPLTKARAKFKNSTLRYECDQTFSDECEFAARAEGE